MNPVHKNVTAVYAAGYTDYEGLSTWRAMPTRNVPIDAMEPFIFLNHHGPQSYPAGNKCLPFGPHPHKGFETVTFIIKGDLVHQDSTGFISNIREGGIQWMTAGSGIIHSETSSDAFRANGGTVEMLQLWLNLPAKYKNTPPAYIGLQQADVPQAQLDNGNVTLSLTSGTWAGIKAPIQSLADVQLATVQITAGAAWSITVPPGRRVLYYVISGKVAVNNTPAEAYDLVEFGADGALIHTIAEEDAMLLVGHAVPNNEPIVAHGPFVMNTHDEIRQAFVDYQNGKFGQWQG
jgi:redox-sensitive bicupin YhaK (pirin superfamily)